MPRVLASRVATKPIEPWLLMEGAVIDPGFGRALITYGSAVADAHAIAAAAAASTDRSVG